MTLSGLEFSLIVPTSNGYIQCPRVRETLLSVFNFAASDLLFTPPLCNFVFPTNNPCPIINEIVKRSNNHRVLYDRFDGLGSI